MRPADGGASSREATRLQFRDYRMLCDAAPNPLRYYVHGAGVDEPLVWYEGSAKRWLHADRQGSIIATSDASGAVTPYTYGAYGEPSDWGPLRFRYTGQIALQEAQVYHYKARVYEPTMGRFLQTDPVGYDAGDLNLYAYVKDDPTDLTDPSGLCGGKAPTPAPPPKPGEPTGTVEGVEVVGKCPAAPISPAPRPAPGPLTHPPTRPVRPQNKPPQNNSVACQVARDFDQWAKEDAQTAWGAAGLGALSKKLPAPLIRGAKGFIGVAEVFGIASTFESGASAYINGAMSGDWSKAAALGAQKFISNASGAGGFVGETAGMLSDQVSDRMMKGPCD